MGAEAVQHKGECPKRVHYVGQPRGHAGDYDAPVEFNGRWYCGRCHRLLTNDEANPPTTPEGAASDD